MNLRIAVNLLWLVVFSMQEASIYDGCMLWNTKENKLIFSCKTNDLQTPLSLFDNRRKEHAKCIFEHNENQSIRCSSRNKSRIVNVDVQKKEVRFTIHNFKSRNVDGRWKCVQGNRTFTSNVSILKGIVNDTEVYLEAEIYKTNNTKRVLLRCSACRETRGNNVEFFIDHITEVSISYDPLTGKCTDRNGECNPDICSCLSTRNEYRATFSFDSDDPIIYSCDMQFKDYETAMIFSKTASLRFDGTDFEDMGSLTHVIRPEDRNKESRGETISTTNRKDETDLETENITVVPTVSRHIPIISASFPVVALTAIVSIISAVFVTLTIIYVCKQIIRKKGVPHDYGIQQSIDETIIPLLSQKTEAVKSTDAQTSTEKEAVESTDAQTSTEKEAVESTDAQTSTENGCDSVETMTEKSYLVTVEKNKKTEDMIKSGELKRCFLCSVHDKLESSLFWCLDCGIGLCKKCKDTHQALIHHTIVEIYKLPINYSLSICCSQHKQAGLDYFCIDHEELCCLECRFIDHTSCHKTEYIDVVSKAYIHSQACRDFEDKLHICIGVLTTINVLVKNNIASIEKDSDRVQHIISASRENETAEDDYTRKLNTDLKKTKATCILTLQNHISVTEIMESSIEELKRLFEYFFGNGLSKPLFRFIHSTKHTLNDINAKIQTLSEQLFRLSVYYIDYEEGNPASGRIVISERKHGVFPEKNQSETSVQIPIASSTVSFECEFEISTEKIQGGMAVSHNGSLLVCDTIHQSILMIVENEQHVSIKLTYTPEDISVIPDIDTAVLTCRTDIIQFVDIGKRAMIGTKEVEDSAACSVACTSEYILIGGKLKIIMLDHEGTPITNIETDCSIRKLSYFKKKIYFTEYGSNKVRCIEMNGEKVFCHQTKNVSAPICAIPNPEDHVYILDRGPIKLHKLSTYGQSIRLEIEDKVGLKNPKSMCFNKDYTTLYVLNNGGSSICTLRIEM